MALSNTQLLILSAASQRADHAVTLPPNLKGSAAKKVIDGLLKQRLLQELRAKDDMPVWRLGHDNRPYTLRITKGGLEAIQVERAAERQHENATPGPDKLTAANALAETNSEERPARVRRVSAKKAALPPAKARSSAPPNPDSKHDRVVALLHQPKGATLDTLVKATGWQKHSVRGFLAGTVRKKLKLSLVSEKIDGVRNYRIGASKAVKTANKRRSR